MCLRARGLRLLFRSIKSDIGEHLDVFEFCSSEEVWFLENIALRNRLRLIAQLAKHLGLSVPQKPDIYAHVDQENPVLAVETCGTMLESIECTVEMHKTSNMPAPMVRHYKACCDMSKHKGVLPVLLGDALGVMLIFSDKIGYDSFSICNDTMPFVHNYTGAILCVGVGVGVVLV